jgi:hypothetical protein
VPPPRRPARPGWRRGRDGFYEWKKLNGRKQAYYIRLQDGQPFAFAGLWEHWDRSGDPIDSYTILTTDANEAIGSIHDRMPVILEPWDHELRFDPHAGVPAAVGTHTSGSAPGWCRHCAAEAAGHELGVRTLRSPTASRATPQQRECIMTCPWIFCHPAHASSVPKSDALAAVLAVARAGRLARGSYGWPRRHGLPGDSAGDPGSALHRPPIFFAAG